MSSALKTLELLSFFSPNLPEIGLSQMCRLAGRDKATTYRHLQSLEAAGFIEQNTLTKHYRLGPAILQLAQMREATVPRAEAARGPVTVLAEATGETAHVTVLSGTTLYKLVGCESRQHATRAILDITSFPLHATASGVCAVAFGPEDLMTIACTNLKQFTDSTPTTPAALTAVIDTVKTSGFGRAKGSLESEIQGISAPLFDQTGNLAGAVSVASVGARFNDALEHTIKSNLVIASRDISQNWGGRVPAYIEAAWAKSLSLADQMESAS